MSIFESSPWSSRALSILRIVTGLMFITAGTMKLLGWPMPMPPGVEFKLASEMGLGAILEVFGGLAIVLGLLTRPVAFILCGEMAVAYFQFHAPHSLFPIVNQGLPAVLYCFIFFYLMFAGGGAWSLDALISRKKRAA